MKIELKYNQRAFLKWVFLHKHDDISIDDTNSIRVILKYGYYMSDGTYQRELNKLRNAYMKEYQDTIQK